MKPKNIVVMRRTARDRIITAINESLREVPAFVVANVLSEALSQVTLLDDRQYADAIAEEHSVKERADDGNNN